MRPQRGVAGESTADGAVGHAGRSPQHAGEAVAARRSAVTGWMKQTTRDINCLLALFLLLCIGSVLFVLYAMWGVHREIRWNVLLPFLVERGPLGLLLLCVLRMVSLTYGRAVSLRAAAVFGDRVALSSAIAAHGGYARNFVLHLSETTEEIAGRESRPSSDDAKDDANTPNAPRSIGRVRSDDRRTSCDRVR